MKCGEAARYASLLGDRGGEKKKGQENALFCCVNSPHSLLSHGDIFSAARTVVTFFLASDMNFLLLLIVLLVPGRKSGRERRGLTFPSDALLSW
jgi:hypothetical protein